MGLARSFLVIVFLHVLGDFYFQTDSMAKQKGEQKRIMALHCVEYSLYILPLFLCWRPSRVSASAFFFYLCNPFPGRRAGKTVGGSARLSSGGQR